MRTYTTCLFWVLLLTAAGCLPTKSNQQPSTLITLESGLIEGSTDSTQAIRTFKGIPYAAPPIGDLRWKPPQPVASWEGVRSCTNFAASAIQNEPQPFLCWSEEYLIPKAPISEDCLYLNVWTGAKETTEKRPVLVYIHGGAFISGGGACPVYDGTAMAQKGIVVVNFNYRLGQFGYMAHPELSAESEHHTSGNYNLLDMIAALKWVQRNIAAFGGDPDNVTIAGQSAGAVAINYLTASPMGKGLFHKVIAESGGSFIRASHNGSSISLDSAERKGLAFAHALDCENLAALRAKPAEDILNATAGFDIPIQDGYVVTAQNLATYLNGQQTDVPLLLGWNKDDLEGGTITQTEFRERIQNRFGELSEVVLKAYPSPTDAAATQSLAYMIRDELGVEMYTWAKEQVKTGKSKVFMYNFHRDLPGNSNGRDFGAFHSGEIPYAYDNLHMLNRPWTETDYKIADIMSDYWVNFMMTGDPNGADLPTWPTYDPAREQVMVFDSVTGATTLPTKSNMELWEQYYAMTSK
ncbi:MAG: carboxylesterase family protein [Bacteroidota bacterium]